MESSNCVLHIARGDSAGPMQKPVRKRRLPMVNMGDDAEISNMRCVHLLNCRVKSVE